MANQTGGENERALFDGEDLGSDNAGESEPLHRPEADKKKEKACV